MAIFKDHMVDINQLLELIPQALLIHLSAHTKVDYYSKVLQGKKMFYLLMYGLLENDRLSQRTLEYAFSDPVFKMLFNLDQDERLRGSSISERLSKIDSSFFKQIYECIYEQFSELYSSAGGRKYNLIREDSTIVSDVSGKMSEGLCQNGCKAVKYSMVFDGILPCLAEVLLAPTCSSEDIALPEVVLNHVKQETGHQNIYLLDRGLQSTGNMHIFSKKQIAFIACCKENRKYVELESLMTDESPADWETLTLLQDSIIHLYGSKTGISKKGKKYHKEILVEEPFRLIIVRSKDDESKEYWFVCNDFELSAQEIADAYRRRWDIEVFFRFIKQELNVNRLISLNRNGIEVMLYMTLIVAMMVLIYKHANKIGYKTAKRRFTMEMRNLIISMIVIECGGDPSVFFKT
jgi:hypothetical protein